ncbi:MAG TPA: hypothetical protein VM890_16945, partial [Longimicrobium sp.]|nr:hypothetical protein [Longimicrobium sp.]
MLAAETVRAVDGYWAGVFGCTPAELRPTSPAVRPRPPGDGGTGVYVMTFGSAPVAMLPPARFAAARAGVTDALARGLDDASAWPRVFADAFETIVGPAAVAYA